MSLHRRRHGPRVLDNAGQDFRSRDRAETRAAIRSPEGIAAFEAKHGIKLGVTNGRVTTMRYSTETCFPTK